jgi:hypothetical protein
MALLASIGSVALPWLLGSALVLALRRRGAAAPAPGGICWTLGAGWLLGAFLLTLWMRALAVAKIDFGLATSGGPLALAAAALVAWRLRRSNAAVLQAARHAWEQLRGNGMPRWPRTLWFALLAWLAVRAALALVEVVLRPLYPWEAWTRWATKARVYCEIGTMVRFTDAEGWFAAAGSSWFDAGPREPSTVPLLQAWSCIAMGRWDDTLVNLPWWVTAVAIALAVFGALRAFGVAPLGALFGTWLAASLPLFATHVALAGYADLFLTGFFTLAILALLRWHFAHAPGDAVIGALSLAACALTKVTGVIWVAVLVPGLCVMLAPARGQRIAAVLLAAVVALLLVLVRLRPTLGGLPLHVEFAPEWGALAASLFLLDNWHLLWYAAAVVLALGWRQALANALAPLTFTLAGALMYVLVVFCFPGITSRLGDATTFNRSALVLAPGLAVWLVLTFRAWARQWTAARAAAGAPA